jgi:hypothetical protein
MAAVKIRVIQLRDDDRDAYQARLSALEELATYPLGQDRFKISHGADYFAFFDRMGATHFFLAMDGDRVAAAGCGVLRRVPLRQGARPSRAWYGCDLKVHPEYRRNHIPLTMLRSAFCPHYLRSPRGYGISMNPSDGSPNPMVRLLGHWRWTPVRLAGVLGIYSLDADAMRDVSGLVQDALGPISFFSPAGIKDIVLHSTGQPMPLLHAQYGAHLLPQAATVEPFADHVHMVCCLETDPLARSLAARGHRPGATASVVAHGMRRCDWRFILTSEI